MAMGHLLPHRTRAFIAQHSEDRRRRKTTVIKPIGEFETLKRDQLKARIFFLILLFPPRAGVPEMGWISSSTCISCNRIGNQGLVAGHGANTQALCCNYLGRYSETCLPRWPPRTKLRFSLQPALFASTSYFVLLSFFLSFFFFHLGAWVWDVCHVDFVGFGDVGLVQRRIALTYMMQDGLGLLSGRKDANRPYYSPEYS